MKNVKMMLTGVLVLAIVGGAMSFRAKYHGVIYENDPTTGNCTRELTGFTIVESGGSPAEASSVPRTGACGTAEVVFDI